jgi:hypothetical protein
LTIQYILITRFNLDYKRIVKESLGLDPEEWLEDRINLFFDYCYPSILHQSDKNFKWWVYFDSLTSSEVIEKFREKDKADLIEFKFSTWGKFREDILLALNTIPGPYDFLLNARVDSDDALSKFSIEEIKKYFSANIDDFPDSFILNPLTGLIYDTKNTILYQKKLKNNPFQVLVQKHGKILNSVFTFQHQTASKHFEVFNISAIPFWLIVVHGGNWLNVKSGRPMLFKESKIRKYFPSLILPQSHKSTSVFTKEYLNYFKIMMGKAISKLYNLKN